MVCLTCGQNKKRSKIRQTRRGVMSVRTHLRVCTTGLPQNHSGSDAFCIQLYWQLYDSKLELHLSSAYSRFFTIRTRLERLWHKDAVIHAQCEYRITNCNRTAHSTHHIIIAFKWMAVNSLFDFNFIWINHSRLVFVIKILPLWPAYRIWLGAATGPLTAFIVSCVVVGSAFTRSPIAHRRKRNAVCS